MTFEDRYEITLEADFETNVPMPVVTIEPRELDLDVLQRGLMPVINFVLTNHGLIRAEDVNFRLPSVGNHAFMHLEMVRIIVEIISHLLFIKIYVYTVNIQKHYCFKMMPCNRGPASCVVPLLVTVWQR